ncbi:MAG: PAS domain S-box protein, partial [Gammaproteobacteria bacterium]
MLIAMRGRIKCAQRTFPQLSNPPHLTSPTRGESVNQLTIGIAALVLVCTAFSVLWLRTRSRSRLGRADQAHRAAFEQSPNGVLLVDAESLRIVDANPAVQRNLGYTLEELRGLTLSQLFSDDGAEPEALLRRLRNPSPQLPIEARQRCKDGTLRNVEVSGHRLDLDKRHVLALTAHDITVRRKAEAQLLEKQQHLDHLAHHDQLTGLPNRLFLAAYLPGAIEDAKRS